MWVNLIPLIAIIQISFAWSNNLGIGSVDEIFAVAVGGEQIHTPISGPFYQGKKEMKSVVMINHSRVAIGKFIIAFENDGRFDLIEIKWLCPGT